MTQMAQKLTKKRKQELLFEALKGTLGNITAALKILEKTGVKIARKTYYRWINSDVKFREKVDSLLEIEVDFYEAALRGLIKDGNVAATIYALKCKGAKRGWSEDKNPINPELNYDEEQIDLLQNYEPELSAEKSKHSKIKKRC